MSLREMNNSGRLEPVPTLPHRAEFDQTWLVITLQERTAIEEEINRRLNQILTSPNPNWGSITNTSIEGGKPNPITGIRGDWTGTVFEPIYQACNLSEDRAGMLYGNVWKKVIIERLHDRWIGMRSDPTFPNRGITLAGKTYFPDTSAVDE